MSALYNLINMTMNDIYKAYENGDYKTDMEYPKIKRFLETHIFDEEKSVRWNRDKVIELNEQNKAEQREYRDKVREMENKFVADFVDAMVEDLSIKTEQAMIVFKFMKNEMDIPFSDMASYADEVIEMIAEFNKFK